VFGVFEIPSSLKSPLLSRRTILTILSTKNKC